MESCMAHIMRVTVKTRCPATFKDPKLAKKNQNRQINLSYFS
jgi:hypothetical protein